MAKVTLKQSEQLYDWMKSKGKEVLMYGVACQPLTENRYVVRPSERGQVRNGEFLVLSPEYLASIYGRVSHRQVTKQQSVRFIYNRLNQAVEMVDYNRRVSAV